MRGPTLVALAYGALVIAFGAAIATAPLPILLDRFVPDDAFYYFNTARIFATTGHSTFDGLHFTNGYQPLWFLLSVPVHLVFPAGGELPLRVMILLEVALGAAGAALLARTAARLFGAVPAAGAGVLWLVVYQRSTANGLETGVLALTFAWLLDRYLAFTRADAGARGGLAVRLGVLAGLTFLARTDMLFVVGALGLALWMERRTGDGRDWLRYAVPAGVIAGGYVLMNLWLTGHAMPVSGAAKVFHSGVARDAAMVASGASPVATVLSNLAWPLTPGAEWALIALLAPVALIVPARLAPAGTPFRTVWAAWPFVAGVWAAYVFYGVMFFGGFTRTLWYYGPLLMVGWLGCAGVFAALGRMPGLGAAPWVLSAALAALVVGAPMSGWFAGGAVAALAAGAARRRWLSGVAGPLSATALLLSALAAWSVLWWHGVTLGSWAMATGIAIALAAAIDQRSAPRLAAAAAIAVLVVPASAIHAVNLKADLEGSASHWNAHLLAGAEWARDALPPEATVWAASAGVLGYFSGRTVVNTDGLANSYEFLEHVLPRDIGAFVRQFDYAIDAFEVGDDSLTRFFPEGCFVPLPPGVAPPPFDDGGRPRALQVYQMHPTGLVDCAARR